MKVYYQGRPKGLLPMIKICTLWLWEAGFRIGDRIEVAYLDNQLVITKIEAVDQSNKT